MFVFHRSTRAGDYCTGILKVTTAISETLGFKVTENAHIYKGATHNKSAYAPHLSAGRWGPDVGSAQWATGK